MSSKNRFTSRYNSSRFAHLPDLEERDIGRPRFVRKNPIVAGQLEYLVQPIFDFYGVAVATVVTKQTLFALPIGQSYTPSGGAAFTKTQYHTNLVQAGMLDAPKKHLIKAVAVVLRSDMNAGDANSFGGTTDVELKISGKSYWQALATKCPAGAGIFGSGASGTTAAATTQSFTTVSNGWPSAQNVATITDPMPQIPGLDAMEPILGQLLEQNQNFFVVIDPTIAGVAAFTTAAAAPAGGQFAGTGVNAHVYLEGVLARAIL